MALPRTVPALRYEARYAAEVVKPLVPRTLRRAIRHAALGPLRAAYRGEGVCCPVCGLASRSFVGRPLTPLTGMCPRCGSFGRHRAVMLFLQARTDVLRAAGRRVLHFAPEPSLMRRLRRQAGLDYIPADIDPGPGVLQVDMTDIRLDGLFDGVIASHVLEHIPDDRAAMRELFRVLRPGGWALLIVPITADRTLEDPAVRTPRQRFEVFGQLDHVRRYGPDFAERLQDVGFDVSAEYYGRTLDEADRARHGIGVNDLFHFCVKPERVPDVHGAGEGAGTGLREEHRRE